MKKSLFPILMMLAIALTACSFSSVATPSGSTSNDVPTATQLAVGTLKLEGTDHDISADQAEELVLYWQLYNDLSQSETAAQEEVEAVTAQIQETLTDEQVQTIKDMQITQEDVLTSIQGITVTSSDSGTIASSGSTSNGGMPAGGPLPDGGGAPLDGGMPADMGGAAPVSRTDQSQNGQAGSNPVGIAGVPSALVDAVIQFLNGKIVT